MPTNQEIADYINDLTPNNRRIWNYNCENVLYREDSGTMPSGMQDWIDDVEALSAADVADVDSKLDGDLRLNHDPC